MAWGDHDQSRSKSELLSKIPTDKERISSDGDYTRGIVDHQNLRDLIVTMFAGSGSGPGYGGWIRVVDIEPISPGVISDKVFQDSPQDTVLQSCKSDKQTFRVRVKASFPIANVGGIDFLLTESIDGGYYEGLADVTISDSGNVEAVTINPDGVDGSKDTVSVVLEPAPELLSLEFTGGYPGIQTELKQGDSFSIHGTTDVPCTGVRILDHEACEFAEITFASTTNFSVAVTIANRGDSAVLRPARVQARNAAGAYGSTRDTNELGGTVDGVDVVNCNNLHPSVSFGTIAYPGVQGAIKDSESAFANFFVSNQDSVFFDSPTSELAVVNPTLVEFPKEAYRIAGDYNVSTHNLSCTANRVANDATSIATALVKIAHVACTIEASLPASRLRSGGNDGTSIQNHTITLSANQELLSAPSMGEETGGGTFIGSWAGGPEIWTRTLQVHDNDVKGSYTWQSPSATNLAGLVTSVLTGSDAYVLGGFVQRDITFGPFSQQEPLGVAVVDYSKLQAGILTATNQPSIRHTPQGDTGDATDEYTILVLGVNPSQLWWNDIAAASSNSSGTAQLLEIEELP